MILFQYFSLNRKFTAQVDLKTKSINQLDFFVNWEIYFWNKLPNQVNNSNSDKRKEIKIKLDDFRNNGKKKKH